MDENAKRDQNRVPVTLCVNADERTKTIMLRVDPVTGYVIVDNQGAVGLTTNIENAEDDQNRVHTLLFADETNAEGTGCARTDTDNRLVVKFV